jgi:hypothetical protein
LFIKREYHDGGGSVFFYIVSCGETSHLLLLILNSRNSQLYLLLVLSTLKSTTFFPVFFLCGFKTAKRSVYEVILKVNILWVLFMDDDVITYTAIFPTSQQEKLQNLLFFNCLKYNLKMRIRAKRSFLLQS